MSVTPISAGYQDYSGTNIPVVYSKKLLLKLYEKLVAAEIMNTDYEGEIRDMGDTVIVREEAEITTFPYKKGMKLPIQVPTSSVQEMLIDQARAWNVIFDDVDRRQFDIDHPKHWTTRGAYNIKVDIDTDVLGYIYGQAHASNKGTSAGLKSADINLGVSGTPLAVTKGNVLDILTDCETVLDEQPGLSEEEDRWIVVPMWFKGVLSKSDLKDCSLTGDDKSLLRSNGRIGKIGRFTIYCSNLLTTASSGGKTAFEIPFGVKMGATFAAQLTKSEKLRCQDTFGDLYRGLSVYGRKVFRPACVGHLHAYKG